MKRSKEYFVSVLKESYIHPITILSALPSAGVGALAILMLFGFDFSLIALIGIVLLIGIVKKNGIMMVDFAITAERDENLEPEAAIRKAALLRFHSIHSEIRQPPGYAMVDGLLVSQALTLFAPPSSISISTGSRTRLRVGAVRRILTMRI